MAGLRYGEDMDFEERAKALTQNLMMRDEVKEWKHLIKMEILQPQYSVDQVQTLQSLTTVENSLIDAVVQKTGIAALVKRTVINLHCEAMQATSEALTTQTRGKIVDERVLPGTRMTDGCNFDVVRAARNSWERVTSDEMLRVASELGRPLVALKATEETVHHETVSATGSPKAQIVKPSKSVRLLYDGYAMQ